MENLNIQLSPAMLALVPVVAAIIQVLKKFLAIKHIPNKITIFIKELLPFASILIAFGLLNYQKVSEPLLPAIIIGLTACGGFDLLKQKKNNSQPNS
jgi:hypothetical protein